MKVSVILTSYNHSKYIHESIESVLNQTFQDYELIIIDDFSQDNSRDIIDRYTDSRIVKVFHDKNYGEGVLAEGIFQYARGDYIAVHHSDDVWEYDKLEKQVAFLDKHSDYAGVFTNAEIINDNGEIYTEETGFYYNLFQVDNCNRYEWLNRFFYKGNCLCHPSLLMRKQIYMDVQPFIHGIRQIPDMIMWIKICLRHEIFVLPEKLVRFRVHQNGKNTSGLRADTQIRSTFELFIMLNNYLQINSKEEFLKIFPKAEEYASGKDFLIEYALGRICLEDGMQKYTRLFGLQLMYNILNNPVHLAIVKRQYNYNHKSFIEDTGKVDIFKVLPAMSNQRATLYWDDGEGWKENNKIEYKYFLTDEYEFDWSFSLDLPEGGIKRLRFDPAEAIYVKCCLKDCKSDGEKIKLYAENTFFHNADEDIFMDLDPIYVSCEPIYSGKEIHICGTLIRMSEKEIAERINQTLREIEILNEKIKCVDKDYEEAKTLFFNEQSIKEKLISSLNEVTVENEKLQKMSKVSEQRYFNLEEKHRQLEKDYVELDNKYKELKNNYAQLKDGYERLENQDIIKYLKGLKLFRRK